ncbi:serine/threonine-protein kinase [Actinoplanes sp. NBRC 103695]|uniref:serine/threonine protein kinase n=1 Tax=Actinoplanes sp. NBRC 103695 TaxID=3032202 RepID=UPI0024A2DC6A|nr:serine/threonine-protein kinase [Actinoplanes sp. NBRC 103695]GLZ01945.1 hypothetical protein Acsp02_91960 [Actinoplanes sp. NBRC 103695]
MDEDPRSSGGVRQEPDGAHTVDLSGRCVGSSYILVKPIGQGATGTVWRGVDRASGEPVAVKLLHESLLRQPKLVTRFVQERTILLMLRHRNVVRVRDLFSVGESLGLVMDLVAGGSLRDHLREHHTIAAGEAARLAGQLAAALAEAHGLNVVHRDLKPDNILLQTENGRLETRLTDFGIARVLTMPSITTPNAVVGTPHYMSPEAFHGSAASPAADIYALGIVLYEMVTGRPPYHGDSVHELMQRHLQGDLDRPGGVPEKLWTVITSCLEQKPRLRPTAEELVSELADVARAVSAAPRLPAPAVLPQQPHPSSPPLSVVPVPRVPKRPHNKARSWRWARPGTVLTVIAATMLASGVATTAWHVTRSGADPADVRVIAAQPAPAQSRTAPAADAAPAATTAPRGKAEVVDRAVPAPSEDKPDRVRPAVPKPSATRQSATLRRQPEARPYGPWACRQVVALDMSNPLVAKPCQSTGKDVQMRAVLTARAGGHATVSLALQENGRTVAGPYTCSNLIFTEDGTTRECGPRTAPAVRGHRYTVRMSWSFSRQGRVNNGQASGEGFTF